MKKFKLFGNSSQIEDNGARELYKALSTEEYTQYPYEKCDLDDGMSVFNQVIGGYWKPRFLMDERNQAAVEFMDNSSFGSIFEPQSLRVFILLYKQKSLFLFISVV